MKPRPTKALCIVQDVLQRHHSATTASTTATNNMTTAAPPATTSPHTSVPAPATSLRKPDLTKGADQQHNSSSHTYTNTYIHGSINTMSPRQCIMQQHPQQHIDQSRLAWPDEAIFIIAFSMLIMASSAIVLLIETCYRGGSPLPGILN